MQGGLLLDVVIREGAAILELLTGKDQPLLIWGNALLVLNFGLDVLNGVRRLNLEGDGLAGQGLDENLHSTSETEDQMQGGLLLNVVVRESSAIFKLFTSKDQSLLIWGNALLVLNFGLHIFNGVRGLNLEGDGLASQSLDKNLHTTSQTEDQMQGGLLLDVVVREGTAILELLTGKDQP